MPTTQRRLGPYADVRVVDVTNLAGSVVVHYADTKRTMPVVEGPMLQVSRVRATTEIASGGITLVLSGPCGAVNARAIDGPGRTHVVRRDESFRRRANGSPIRVKMFVRAGTIVLH